MSSVPGYHAFLSYNSGDRPLVLEIADALKGRDCSCFLDQWYLVPGRDWVDALEKALASSRSVAVFLGPGDMGRWQQRERAWALDRQAADPQFAVIPVLLPGCKPRQDFLRLMTWIDLRQNQGDPAQLDRLAAAIRGEALPAEGQREPRATVCPYRGLLYFREEDAAFFFGRETYVRQLVEKVERRTLVAVVGASGSGKSSVVRAGLVSRLRGRDRRPVWEIVTMVPGTDPLHALAGGLLPLIDDEFGEPNASDYINRSSRSGHPWRTEIT